MLQAVLPELFRFSDAARRTLAASSAAVVDRKRAAARVGVFFKPGILRYSPALDEALRALVRDETASRAERYAALDVLRSWRIELDPHLYPFARTPLRELKRRRRVAAKGGRA
jgi:hypothetical protein